jgi:PAS domain S-box-containing protein
MTLLHAAHGWTGGSTPRARLVRRASALAAASSAALLLLGLPRRRALRGAVARWHDAAAGVRGGRAFLGAVTQALDEGVYTIDLAGRITWVNAAAERMLGRRARELVGLLFKDALGCRRIDAPCSGTKCRLRNVMLTGEPYRAANDLLTRADGTTFPVRYSSAPIVRGGSVVGAVVAFQDVTAERRAAANEKFLADATEQLSRSIDYDETLASVARLALPHLGDWCMAVVVEEDGTPRRVAVQARQPERAEAALEMLRRYPIDLDADHGAGRVLRTGEPELLPVVADFVGRAGTTVRTRAAILDRLGLRSFMAVPMWSRGRLVGTLDFGITGTGRTFTAEDLAVAMELGRRCALAIENARLHQRARDAVRAREHMLAVVSHDLRNPLGAIRMAARSAAKCGEEDGAPRVRRAAATIARSCDRMQRLIDDLVDLARVDAGHLSIARADCAARPLALDAIDAVALLAAEAGVRLECDVGADAPAVHADGDRVQQVLANLLANAIKVTPGGGRVWVRCRARRGAAVFSVSDTGPGIGPAEQARIFEPYVRGAEAPYRGTGLGLSIARGIVEALGGRLWVVSRRGKGATFRFTLPLASAATASPALVD